MGKQILHIEAGDDTWTPTQQELQHLVRKFRRAIAGAVESSQIGIVATRNAVRVHIIEIDSGEPAREIIN